MAIDITRIEVMDDLKTEILRRQSADESLSVAESLWLEARSLMMDWIRHEHPDWTQERVEKEVAHRLWNVARP